MTLEFRKQRIRTLRDLSRRIERFGSLSAPEQEEREALKVEDLARLVALRQERRARTSGEVQFAHKVDA